MLFPLYSHKWDELLCHAKLESSLIRQKPRTGKHSAHQATPATPQANMSVRDEEPGPVCATNRNCRPRMTDKESCSRRRPD